MINTDGLAQQAITFLGRPSFLRFRTTTKVTTVEGVWRDDTRIAESWQQSQCPRLLLSEFFRPRI